MQKWYPNSVVATFNDGADSIFITSLQIQLLNAMRIDIMCDMYLRDSVKQSTREKRDKSLHIKVSG